MNMEGPSYRRHRYPAQIIGRAVWLYHRFSLSFRDLEDLLAERGIVVSYGTIWQWCAKFGPAYARALKKRSGRLGDTWFLDELFVTIRGERCYLWRAADQDRDTLDILLQRRRDRRAAARFFRKLLKGEGRSPRRLVADKLRSYSAAKRETMPSVVHDTKPYANNRAELSRQPTRERERKMRRFKSPGQAQRFLAVHAMIGNLFRLGRHLTKAVHYRSLRSAAFLQWQEATCTQ